MAYIKPRFINLTIIKKQTLRVEKLVGEKYKIKETSIKKEKLLIERKRFEEREKKIEGKSDAEEKKISGKISVPRLGFLDIIKNFLFKVLLGAFAIKLLPHLPKLKGVLIGAFKLNDFILQFSGSLLNALVTFVDKVYQLVDFGKQQAKLLGGDTGLRTYDNALGMANKMINSMVIAGMLFSDLVEMDTTANIKSQGVDLAQEKIGQEIAKRQGFRAIISNAAQRIVMLSRAAAAPLLVGLAASALGELMFQQRKYTTKLEADTYKKIEEAQKDKNLFTRALKLTFYNTLALPGLRFYNFLSTGIGTLLDIIGTPFRYLGELINFGVMSLSGDVQGIKKQRENLGKLDARIREQLRQITNVLSFGLLAKEKGSFGSLYGDEAKRAMGYAQGGPVTRGGVYIDTITRTVGKTAKAKRVISVPTAPLQPGADVNGNLPYKNQDLSKIEAFYPKPTDPGTVSSYRYLESTYNIVGSTKFIHPLLEMTVKTLFGDKPPESDFKAIGSGLNNFINDILDTTKVPGKDVVVSDETGPVDISNWASGIAKDSMMNSINSILSDLSHQLTLKRSTATGREPKQEKGGGTITENPLAQFSGEAQFVIGDSIAHGFAGRSGNGSENDDSMVGRGSAKVLAILKAKGDALKGALIDLSTGIANSTADFTSVEEQLKYLKSIGARVRILGVANDFSKERGGINEKLQQLASKYGFYFYGGYVGGADKLHGTDEDYVGMRRKRERETAAVSTQDSVDLGDIGSGKDKKIYLHWTAGSYGGVSSNYHTTITGDGKINRMTPYNRFNVGHTFRRNSNAVGLSVAAMGGDPDPWSIPVKSIQYQKMAEEASAIAKAWGWNKSDINIKNIMTHAEAASNKDGRRMHDNYGPRAWGGTGERWDLFQLYKNDSPGSGGDSIRNMIKSKMLHGGYIKETGKYLTHPGEYVVDSDSTKLFGINFYDIINQVETVSQRKSVANSLISILSQYTEDGFPETQDTYYIPEQTTVTVIPSSVIPIRGGFGFTKLAVDPTQDSLYM